MVAEIFNIFFRDTSSHWGSLKLSKLPRELCAHGDDFDRDDLEREIHSFRWTNFDFNRKQITQALKDKVVNNHASVNARRKDRTS